MIPRVKIPLHVQSEWAALSRTDDPELNRRSIDEIRKWLDGFAESLTSVDPKNPPGDPKLFGHAKSNVAGITSSEFDGVEMATLRYWLKWWSDPQRSQWGREEAGRDPEAEAAKVLREIEARERP